MCGNHGCRRSRTKAQLSKNCCLSAQDSSACWLGIRTSNDPRKTYYVSLFQSDCEVSDRGEAEEGSSDTYPQIRSSFEGSSDTYLFCIQSCLRSLRHNRRAYLRPQSRALCATPSNPGHVIDSWSTRLAASQMLTKRDNTILYELFGNVINQLALTTSHQYCAHMPQPGIVAKPEG